MGGIKAQMGERPPVTDYPKASLKEPQVAGHTAAGPGIPVAQSTEEKVLQLRHRVEVLESELAEKEAMLKKGDFRHHPGHDHRFTLEQEEKEARHRLLEARKHLHGEEQLLLKEQREMQNAMKHLDQLQAPHMIPKAPGDTEAMQATKELLKK